MGYSKHTTSAKIECVRRYFSDPDISIRKLAEEKGVSFSTLSHWIKAARKARLLSPGEALPAMVEVALPGDYIYWLDNNYKERIKYMKTIGNFTFTETSVKDVYVIEPKKYGDNRGYFMETYKESDFAEAGLTYKFIQDNQSKSKKGVLRGLHFQKTFPQAKLVRCIEGEVFDVCVDLRKGSPTYGKWEGVILSAEKGNQFMIPRGFAHGFVVLSETATFCYKCDELYHPEDEGGIMWNDPDVGIDWPKAGDILLSEKDKKHPALKELKIEF